MKFGVVLCRCAQRYFLAHVKQAACQGQVRYTAWSEPLPTSLSKCDASQSGVAPWSSIAAPWNSRGAAKTKNARSTSIMPRNALSYKHVLHLCFAGSCSDQQGIKYSIHYTALLNIQHQYILNLVIFGHLDHKGPVVAMHASTTSAVPGWRENKKKKGDHGNGSPSEGGLIGGLGHDYQVCCARRS